MGLSGPLPHVAHRPVSQRSSDTIHLPFSMADYPDPIYRIMGFKALRQKTSGDPASPPRELDKKSVETSEKKEKKRMQNRIAQRVYRRRLKLRMQELEAKVEGQKQHANTVLGSTPITTLSEDEGVTPGGLKVGLDEGRLDSRVASAVTPEQPQLPLSNLDRCDSIDNGWSWAVIQATTSGSSTRSDNSNRFKQGHHERTDGSRNCTVLQSRTPESSSLTDVTYSVHDSDILIDKDQASATGHSSTSDAILETLPAIPVSRDSGQSPLNAQEYEELSLLVHLDTDLWPGPDLICDTDYDGLNFEDVPMRDALPHFTRDLPINIPTVTNASPDKLFPVKQGTATTPSIMTMTRPPLPSLRDQIKVEHNVSNGSTSRKMPTDVRINEVVKAALSVGFQDFDDMVTTFYTARFAQSSPLSRLQKISRNRKLPQLVASLGNAAASWNPQERRGVNEEFVRSAEAMLAHKCQTLRRQEVFQEGQPCLERDDFLNMSTSKLPDERLYDELPELWSLVRTLSTSHATMRTGSQEHTIFPTFVALLTSSRPSL